MNKELIEAMLHPLGQRQFYLEQEKAYILKIKNIYRQLLKKMEETEK